MGTNSVLQIFEEFMGNNWDESVEDEGCQSAANLFESEMDKFAKHWFKSKGLKIKRIAEFEDDGEYQVIFEVYSVLDGMFLVFVALEGYYSSYAGGEYHDCSIVKPYIKTETRYR